MACGSLSGFMGEFQSMDTHACDTSQPNVYNRISSAHSILSYFTQTVFMMNFPARLLSTLREPLIIAGIIILGWYPMESLASNAPLIPTEVVPVDKQPELQTRWQLSDIYPDKGAWLEEKDQMLAKLGQWRGCTDDLGASAARLLECLLLFERIDQQMSRLRVYSRLLVDSDTKNPDYVNLRLRAQVLTTQVADQTSFLRPAIIKLGSGVIDGFIAVEPQLRSFAPWLKDLLRQGTHTLSTPQEQIVAQSGLMAATPYNTYRIFVGSDMPWAELDIANNNHLKLDPPTYKSLRSHSSRPLRRRLYQAYWRRWRAFEPTMGMMLQGQLQKNWFLAQVRHYPTALTASLHEPGVPPQIYRRLMTEVHAHMDNLHRYMRLRQRILGVETLEYPDLYASLSLVKEEFSPAQAKALILSSVDPLGETYQKTLSEAMNAGWMDLFPRPGKRSGAYMNGKAHNVHPYILLNYTGDFNSVSTMAHEWGHAMHRFYSSQAQAYLVSNYATFIAEVASTFNQALLLNFMIEQSDHVEIQLFFLIQAIEQIRNTFFRQALFAEFEEQINQRTQQGETLTGEKLSGLYLKLLRRYYGHDEGIIEIDPIYGIEWASVRHLYLDFYVYQYATSLAASSLLADQVLAGQQGSRERYMNLLRAGRSLPPHELLKNAGVDLSEPEPYQILMDRMNTMLDQVEALIDEREHNDVAAESGN